MRIAEFILQVVAVVAVFVYTYFTYRLLSAQTQQGFENKFFQLLRFHHDIVDAVQVKIYSGATTDIMETPTFATIAGRPAFATFYKHFVQQYASDYRKNPQAPVARLADEAYLSFYERHQDYLGHYFRNLYHLIKFVDNSSVDPSDKTFYTHLVLTCPPKTVPV
ncbi:MAG: putative phage abortive infection protein [Terriglobia bacterium]|jgi:hypothetical protein